MTKIRNKRPYAVEIVDNADDGKVYECAARPGVVDVPPSLAASLLEQEENWSRVGKPKPDDPEPDEEPTPEPEGTTEGEG